MEFNDIQWGDNQWEKYLRQDYWHHTWEQEHTSVFCKIDVILHWHRTSTIN